MSTAQRYKVLNRSQGLVLPILRSLDFNDNTFFTVYCFIKNFIGVTSCTSAVIDTKIEQAMDLVKNHLMYTMRNEVEVLKDRIVELLERIEQLEMENDFLKSNATPEVLRALSNSTATTKYKKIEYESDMKKEDMEVAAIIGNAQHQYTI
ncbi:PREDICTED: protein bunched, class 1/class 3/D/E isoforms-like isoform X1 [Nicrophorus vespilloides]|uniref:Protein bunched, class 1/class 3/D/E isoforms-like isoform X1 n=1 Tax=Nicrophorus vespilloides TaxID=110193 RepID=A0ABM1M3Z8_NICVS|nr:PREDICTED: protein bunched, class 1/class 3/D/E isoforms-like isoform X1 [Nicrophorus vespilloides]